MGLHTSPLKGIHLRTTHLGMLLLLLSLSLNFIRIRMTWEAVTGSCTVPCFGQNAGIPEVSAFEQHRPFQMAISITMKSEVLLHEYLHNPEACTVRLDGQHFGRLTQVLTMFASTDGSSKAKFIWLNFESGHI